uniref:Uncharacterized protein n=1 Tax=Phytophthora ramorum TaxID=164328 RepID=H3H6Y8_PHYRM
MAIDTYYNKARKQQAAAFPRRLRTSKQQAAALSQHNEKLAAELQTSKQHVAALSEHSEQVRVQLEEAKTKAMQHEEESRTLRMEIEALQKKVETAGPEKQDPETQLAVSPRCLCSSASDEDSDESTDESTDEDMDDYVVPPVDLPGSYRAQDLQGGELVGGKYVLFANWGFKRQQQHVRHLRPIPERTDAGGRESPASDGRKEATPATLVEAVSEPMEVPAQTQERRVQKRASDEINDSDDMDHSLRRVRRRLNSCFGCCHQVVEDHDWRQVAGTVGAMN